MLTIGFSEGGGVQQRDQLNPQDTVPGQDRGDDEWKREEARALVRHLPRSDRAAALEIIAYMAAEVIERY